VPDLERAVLDLSAALGRPITSDKSWIVQKCPICEVELRLDHSVLGVRAEERFERLRGELFAFYDQHRCRAPATEDTFQRAERQFVHSGERALALAAAGDTELAARADRESQRLVEWVDRFRRTA